MSTDLGWRWAACGLAGCPLALAGWSGSAPHASHPPFGPVGHPSLVLLMTAAGVQANTSQWVSPFPASACLPLAEAGYVVGPGIRVGAGLTHDGRSPRDDRAKARGRRKGKELEPFLQTTTVHHAVTLQLGHVEVIMPSQDPHKSHPITGSGSNTRIP